MLLMFLGYNVCFEVNKQRLSHDEIFSHCRLCSVLSKIFHTMLWFIIGNKISDCIVFFFKQAIYV